MRPTLLSLLVTLASLLATPCVQAQGHGDDEAAQDLRAQASFRAATAYYEAGDYENALRDFQTSYDLSRRPELLWNLYLCHERLGQWEQAAGALESFLEAGAPGYPEDQVQARLAHLRRRIERRQGGESDQAIEADDADADADVTATGTEGEATAPTTPEDPTPVVAIAGFSIAAVGLLGFAVFGSLTLAEDAALTNECGTHCTASRASTLDVFAIGTDVSLGVALVGAVVGVVGLVLAPHAAPSTTATRWSPSLGPSGAGLTVWGVF